VFTRYSKRPANFQQCNAGRLLDRANTLLGNSEILHQESVPLPTLHDFLFALNILVHDALL